MLTFSLQFDFMLLSFYLGIVLFGTYFPFTARKYESRGCYKYVHIVALVTGVLCSAALVGVQFARGGYRRRIAPIFCLATVESALWGAVVPQCFIAATFLTLVMVLLFRIVQRDEYHCKVSIIFITESLLRMNWAIHNYNYCFL